MIQTFRTEIDSSHLALVDNWNYGAGDSFDQTDELIKHCGKRGLQAWTLATTLRRKCSLGNAQLDIHDGDFVKQLGQASRVRARGLGRLNSFGPGSSW